MKIYSRKNNSETHGMAWNSAIPHGNDIGAPQTQQKDAYGKYITL